MTSDMYAELVSRGTPPRLGEFTVKLVVESIPPSYVDLPGYLQFAYLSNRVAELRGYIRTRRHIRAWRQKRLTRPGAETTSQGNSTRAGDSADA